ncbi:MAG: type II toxin-antitoxin system HicB family antitoxin [Candidatus Electryonea clarkiae]|nr:type II toxin-antitoxin system HicB family antitoxin [Candidatus Electryonea clarkiae]MDP8287116.1 type II toxin-antitoxin system HicB family antitoxin [Candidatus Electryonea clarkiae]
MESIISVKRYTVIFEPAEEGGYVVHVPALNGIVTQGDTLEETEVMAVDLIQGYIETLIMKGLPVPEETSIESDPADLSFKQLAIAV